MSAGLGLGAGALLRAVQHGGHHAGTGGGAVRTEGALFAVAPGLPLPVPRTLTPASKAQQPWPWCSVRLGRLCCPAALGRVSPSPGDWSLHVVHKLQLGEAIGGPRSHAALWIGSQGLARGLRDPGLSAP